VRIEARQQCHACTRHDRRVEGPGLAERVEQRQPAEDDVVSRELAKIGDNNLNDTPTLLDLVEAGLGVALIPEALMARRRALRPIPLSGPTIDWTIGAVSLAPAPSNPAARELWRLLSRLRLSASAKSTRKPSGSRS
jgi:DNA-binding transcriptional LysR family regulator